MDGFIGEYYHTIDTKGRVIIPQKYREDLGDTFILSKGLDGCLWIHPMDEWREFTAKLRELSTIDKESDSSNVFLCQEQQNANLTSRDVFLYRLHSASMQTSRKMLY